MGLIFFQFSFSGATTMPSSGGGGGGGGSGFTWGSESHHMGDENRTMGEE